MSIQWYHCKTCGENYTVVISSEQFYKSKGCPYCNSDNVVRFRPKEEDMEEKICMKD